MIRRAVFGLFDAKDTKIQEATSKADGSVLFTKIPYGSYTIRELSAPYGYHPSDKEWKVDVDGTYVNPTTLLATVENQPAPGRIKILKQDRKQVFRGLSVLKDIRDRLHVPEILFKLVIRTIRRDDHIYFHMYSFR